MELDTSGTHYTSLHPTKLKGLQTTKTKNRTKQYTIIVMLSQQSLRK